MTRRRESWDLEARPPRARSPFFRWYVLAIGTIVLGLVIAPLLISVGVGKMLGPATGATVVRGPGTTRVRITEAGEHLVWYERRSLVDGWYHAEGGTTRETGLNGRVLDDQGRVLGEFTSAPSKRVNLGFIDRSEVAKFRADGACEVQLESSTSDGRAVVLSVGPPVEAHIAQLSMFAAVGTMVSLLLMGFGGLGLLVVMLMHAVTWADRRKAARIHGR